MKIAIIGAGNMGGALARGLAKGSLVKPENICVSNPSTGKLEKLKAEIPGIRVTTDNRTATVGADVIVLAVKPWKMKEVADEIKNSLDYTRQAVASMAGGVPTEEISALFLKADGGMPAVYYVIPNTAIAEMTGMTFLTSVRSTPELDSKMLAMYKELGDAMLVEERLMNAGMALASCGIAYVMRYIRAMTEGGVELGFYASDAQRIVMQTMLGAVSLLSANGLHPEAEIDRVTTPGGITIKGLNAMEEAGFTASVVKGLRASKK
ncbi:MAG: pyrroline-5-carboxylate reductase [Muribaculum sp.]|nr:pyrroline-5-carboxylate reductase [Muribaculum sp.]